MYFAALSPCLWYVHGIATVKASLMSHHYLLKRSVALNVPGFLGSLFLSTWGRTPDATQPPLVSPPTWAEFAHKSSYLLSACIETANIAGVGEYIWKNTYIWYENSVIIFQSNFSLFWGNNLVFHSYMSGLFERRQWILVSLNVFYNCFEMWILCLCQDYVTDITIEQLSFHSIWQLLSIDFHHR